MPYPTLEAALEYASLGYRVLPLKPGTKIPDLRHWPEEASSDAATVRRHFAASAARTHTRPVGHPNVGIATGNGLVVVDVDVKHGGLTPEWMPRTLTATTPSGGFHYYLACDAAVPNSVGRVAPGVDVRGERGQVAAPPSVVETGRRVVNDTMFESWTATYEWLDPTEHIARIASELVIPMDMQQSYLGRQARRFEFRDEVPVGERNNYLTSYAGYLFRQGEDKADVFLELCEEAERLDFTPRPGEVAKIVESVSRYH